MNSAYGNTRLARRLVRVALIVSGLVLFTALCALCAQAGNLLWLVVLVLAGDIGVAWYAIKQGLLFEWRLERTWKAVCCGIDFSGKARSYHKGLKGAYIDGDTKTIYPKLREVRGDRESWTALVYPFAGQTVEEYNKHTTAFTLAFNVPFVVFEPTGTGIIRMRCGPVQVPDMYAYPVERLAEPTPVATDVAAGLRAVPMARDIDGHPFYLPIEGNHLLIAGRTGSGKNSWTSSLVFGLAQARQAGIVRLWGLDPKRVELAYSREVWDEYADTVEGMVELLEKAVSELLERNKQIQGKARKITPSPAMPLNVIVIDELAYLSAMVPDKKLRDRGQAAIGTILVLGRATGYSLVGCSQDPRKEVLGFRDYFPTKVALGMPAPMVDLVLGEGAWDAGAKAEQIPLREAGAGCAYVLDETNNRPLLVRAAWCSDEAIRMMLANPQAFGVESDDSLRQYEQGYTGANTSAQSEPDSQPSDAGQLRWEDLPPEVQRIAQQLAQQWQHRQE
jgi:S-DNA-T family DNA segregation ATPase FtsK/SpoIIIE